MKRISWRLGGRHTQRPALKPFISAHVSFATNRGCFNLDASEKLAWNRRQFFPFNKLHCGFEFGWIWSKYDKIIQEKHVKSRKWRWTSYGMKRISWRLGGRHTQRPALKPFISARVSFATHRGCSISTLQKNLRETADNSFHLISCTAFWIWMNLVQVWQDHSRETCEEQEVEMDIIWNEENFMEARWPPHSEKLQCHLSQPMSACSNSAVALLIWTAGKSDGGRVGNLDASLNFCDTSL